MHALVGVFTVEVSRLDAQRRELEERVVPLFRHQPGFVSATWSVDVAARRHFAVIVLESERLARKLAELLREEAGRSGERLESISVAEVLAAAQR